MKAKVRQLSLALLAVSGIIFTQIVSAECVLKIDRKACPGKETEALKPYAGKNPTEEKITRAPASATSDACIAEGEKASKIVRKGTLSQKTVTVSFDGKDVGTKTGTGECK
jgi:hypothetical protein